ncbi:MAG: HEAT repeat domain-containing protein, partial [Cyanobacteriota bacterium SKYGB_h_bin112]|nr:HEAT repeat domain-containing protein [Cyanobacteriota bacterium SKYGB_h_bin112]
QIGSEGAIPGLLTALADSDASVRRSAAAALGQIGSPHSMTLLKQHLQSAPYAEILQALVTIQANCKYYNYDLVSAPSRADSS